jgi:oxygen-dependent protoporphyrinogen oxidase
MKGKLLMAAGAAVGYVLGTRAGRERYEQIKARAAEIWRDPQVQGRIADLGETVKEKVPVAREKVSETARKVSGSEPRHDGPRAGEGLEVPVGTPTDRAAGGAVNGRVGGPAGGAGAPTTVPGAGRPGSPEPE